MAIQLIPIVFTVNTLAEEAEIIDFQQSLDTGVFVITTLKKPTPDYPWCIVIICDQTVAMLASSRFPVTSIRWIEKREKWGFENTFPPHCPEFTLLEDQVEIVESPKPQGPN